MGAKKGRTCALDLGKVRVGVAVDDELGVMAHSRGTLDPRDAKAFLAALVALADAEGVTRFVVGLPLRMSGREGPEARAAREMAQRIADATGREVELWDERLTSVQAQRALKASEVQFSKHKGKVDEAAACAILESWMHARDVRRRGGG